MRSIYVILALVSTISLYAIKKENTHRGGLVSKQEIMALEKASLSDTLAYSDKIILSGYSKTVSDRDETFYVTNNTPFHLSRIVVDMVYSNAEGKMLHQQEYDVVCDIPSGETRQVAVRSFDARHSHYYYKSRKPRRSAIPYNVKFVIKRYDVALTVK